MTDGTQHADVVTALCNQPEAFTLDLSDDQSPDLSRSSMWHSGMMVGRQTHNRDVTGLNPVCSTLM